MVQLSSAIYIRSNEWYRQYQLVKVGGTYSIVDRGDYYKNNEVRAGYFSHIYAVSPERVKVIEKQIICALQDYKSDELFKDTCVPIIEKWFLDNNVEHMKLTQDEIDEINNAMGRYLVVREYTSGICKGDVDISIINNIVSPVRAFDTGTFSLVLKVNDIANLNKKFTSYFKQYHIQQIGNVQLYENKCVSLIIPWLMQNKFEYQHIGEEQLHRLERTMHIPQDTDLRNRQFQEAHYYN